MRKKTQRRSSLCVTLAFIGAAAVGCGQSGSRPMYKSKEDCLADWNSPEKCEQASPGSNARYFPGMYYGPFISGTQGGLSGLNRSGQSVQSRSIGSIPVTRGGFGSSSMFHSSGG